MTAQVKSGTPRVPVPEPDLTPDEIIARAAGMRERLLDEAEAAAERGGYSEETHAAFTEAGFYRILQPRMFGGYEFGVDTFLRVVIEIGRADPGTAWSLCLAAGHAMHVGSYFSEQAQAEAFGADGHFVCPQRAVPMGKATPVDGGFVLRGRWDYSSGVTHANWYMGTAMGPDPAGGPAPKPLAFLLPRSQVEVLDDWGGDSTIGLQATGSNTVTIDDVFVPAHMTDPYDWKERPLGELGTPGYQLHGNPLYVGRTLTFFILELVSPMVGAAWASFDEYHALLHGRQTSFPPKMPRTESPFFQQWYGEAMGRVDAAQALLLAAAAEYTERAERWAADRAPFGVAEDTRIRQVVQQAGQMAWSAIDLMFSTGGSSAAKRGSRLQRYYRDASMYRTHIGSQYDVYSQSAALASLGEPIAI